jgi:hypothetical protein
VTGVTGSRDSGMWGARQGRGTGRMEPAATLLATMKTDGGEGGILFLENRHLLEFRADNKYLHECRNVSDCLLGLASSIKSR